MIGTILKGLPIIKDIIEVFTGNRKNREVQEHEDVIATKQHLANELSYAANNRTKFDGFVDGMSRLPRPLLAFSVFGFFGWAMTDPHSFTVRMQGLQYVPEPMWVMLLSIVGLYYPIRTFEKLKLARYVAPKIAPKDLISRHYPQVVEEPKPEKYIEPPAPVHEVEHAIAAKNGEDVTFERPKKLPNLEHPNPTLTAWRTKIAPNTG